MKKIGAVICNYNKKDYVIKCIDSVFDQIFEDYDLYVVDNASTDDSVREIEKKYKNRLEIIQNIENLGGSGGFNAGLKKALKKDYQYLILLDNDVYLNPDYFEILYHTMENNPDIGICGGMILVLDSPETIQECGSTIDYQEMKAVQNFKGENCQKKFPKLVDCDHVPACAMIVRCQVIDQIGLMPEENFIFWDDVEWCVKCHRAGYRVVADTEAKAWHKGGGSVATNTFSHYYNYRNKVKFFTTYMQTELLKKNIMAEQTEMKANAILREVFQGIYGSNYSGKYNRAKTMMDAFLDAITGQYGCAENYKIRPLEQIDDRFENLLEKKDSIFIYVNNNEDNTRNILSKIRTIEEKKQQKYRIRLFDHDMAGKEIMDLPIESLVEKVQNFSEKTVPLHVCAHVFSVTEKTQFGFWIDGWCNLILDDNDFSYCYAFKQNFQLFKLCYEDRLKKQITDNTQKNN